MLYANLVILDEICYELSRKCLKNKHEKRYENSINERQLA